MRALVRSCRNKAGQETNNFINAMTRCMNRRSRQAILQIDAPVLYSKRRTVLFWLSQITLLAVLLLLGSLPFLTGGQNITPRPPQTPTTLSTSADTLTRTGQLQAGILTIPRTSVTLSLSLSHKTGSSGQDTPYHPATGRGGQQLQLGRLDNPDCDVFKSLDNPAQPQFCKWNTLFSGDGVAAGTKCAPDPSVTVWIADTILYDCQDITVTTVYFCQIPTDQPLEDIDDIRCSLQIGSIPLSCFYAIDGLNSVGPCQGDPCKDTSSGKNPQPTLDPVTGIPEPSTDPKAKPPASCPIPITTTCTNKFDPVNDWLFGSSQGLLFAGSANAIQTITSQMSAVQTIWSIVAGIALALLSIPFLLAGYQIIQGISSDNQPRAIELLGRVVLIGAAIGMSWFIATQLIGLENQLAQAFSTAFKPADNIYTSMPSANWSCYAKQFFGTLFNLNIDSVNSAIAGADNRAAFASNMDTATLTLIENLPHYILTLLSVLLAVQLVIRLVLLNLHIVLSPLAILCGATPGQIGSDTARHWVKGFLSLLFIQILQLIVLILGSHLIPFAAGNNADWATTLFSNLLPIAVMVLTLNIPRLFNAPVTTLLSSTTAAMGGAVNGISLIIRGL